MTPILAIVRIRHPSGGFNLSPLLLVYGRRAEATRWPSR